MTSLLIPRSPLNAVQKGALCSQQGLPVLLHCGTHPLHFQRSLGLFQTFNFNSFFFSNSFSSPLHCCPPTPTPPSSSSSPPVVVLCHRSSGWKQLHCVCILVMRALVTIPHLFAEVHTELDVANLLIKPQIRRTDRGAACSDQCISV